jgi:hypothetical protein
MSKKNIFHFGAPRPGPPITTGLFSPPLSGSPQGHFTQEERVEHANARHIPQRQSVTGNLIDFSDLEENAKTLDSAIHSSERARKRGRRRRNNVALSSLGLSLEEFQTQVRAPAANAPGVNQVHEVAQDIQAELSEEEDTVHQDSLLEERENSQETVADEEALRDLLSVTDVNGVQDDSEYRNVRRERRTPGPDSFVYEGPNPADYSQVSDLVSDYQNYQNFNELPNAGNDSSLASVFGTGDTVKSPPTLEQRASRERRLALSPSKIMTNRMSTKPGGRADSTRNPSTSSKASPVVSQTSLDSRQTINASNIKSHNGDETFNTEVIQDTVVYSIALKTGRMMSGLEKLSDRLADIQSGNKKVSRVSLLNTAKDLMSMQIDVRNFYENLRTNATCSKSTLDQLRHNLVMLEKFYYSIIGDMNSILHSRGEIPLEPLGRYLTLNSKARRQLREQQLTPEELDFDISKRFKKLISPVKEVVQNPSGMTMTSNHPESINPASANSTLSRRATAHPEMDDENEPPGSSDGAFALPVPLGKEEARNKYLDDLHVGQNDPRAGKFNSILRDPLNTRKSGNNVRINAPDAAELNATSLPDPNSSTASMPEEIRNRSPSFSSDSSNEDSGSDLPFDWTGWNQRFDQEEGAQVPPPPPLEPRKHKRDDESTHPDLSQAFTQMVQLQTSMLRSMELSNQSQASENARVSRRFQDTLDVFSKVGQKGNFEDSFEDKVGDPFYLNLPTPWNVLPRKKGKLSDERQAMGIAKNNMFSGDAKDYLSWRVVHLENVHSAKIPVMQKLSATLDRLSDSDPWLKSLKDAITFMPHDYDNIIRQLESRYGGDNRIMRMLCNKLMGCAPLQRRSINSVRTLLQNFLGFKNFATNQGLENWFSNDFILTFVKSRLFKSDDLDHFQSTCMQYDWTPDFIGIIQWLQYLVKIMSDREAVSEFRVIDKIEPQARAKTFLTSAFNTSPASSSHVSVDPPVQDPRDPVEEAPAAHLHSVAAPAEDLYEDYMSDISLQNSDDEDEIARVLYGSGKSPQFSLPPCALCTGQNHLMKDCVPFSKLNPKEKLRVIIDAEMCFKCLSKRHLSNACTRTIKCFTCEKPHNSLLHDCLMKSK